MGTDALRLSTSFIPSTSKSLPSAWSEPTRRLHARCSPYFSHRCTAAPFTLHSLPHSRSAVVQAHVTQTQNMTVPTLPPAFLQKYGPWAVVTGSSSGIGAEFTRQLCAAGFNVAVVARREDRLHELRDSLTAATGASVVAITADLTTSDGRDKLLAETENLDVGLLINNAGIEFHGSFFRHSSKRVENMLTLNVTAVTLMAQAFGRRLCRRGRGGILFVSSISSLGMPWLATYSSTKSFVTCLALTLRDELMRHGVDCMALEPGLVRSEMTLPPDEANPSTKESSNQNASLMDTNVCVYEALTMFGRRARYTPGFRNRLIRSIFMLLPRPWAIWILSEIFLKMDRRLPEL